MALEPTTLSLLVGGLLVLTLIVYGLRDLIRFSLYRTLAVGGVVFRESVRRKVLWLTPLAMLAVLLLIQLQDPTDEADAIRQAIRSCLFASGLVAIVVPLILACTNLPREIGNRVIFTLVTKPLTRFELLIGKVIGFAGLSAVLLLMMGAFSLALLWMLNLTLVNRIETALQSALPAESRRPYLQHVVEKGLLQAQRVDNGDDLQVYAEPPVQAKDGPESPRYFPAGSYYAAVPFELDPQLVESVRLEPAAQMVIRLRLPWKLRDPDNADTPAAPLVSVQILDWNLTNVIPPSAIVGNGVRLRKDAAAPWTEAPMVFLDADQTLAAVDAATRGTVYVAVYGLNPEYVFGMTADSVQIGFVDGQQHEFATLEPAVGTDPRGNILLRTYLGSTGLGLSGPDEDQPAPVGVLAFRDTPRAEADDDERVDIELRVVVERLGGVLDESDDSLLEAVVYNQETGFTSEPAILFPETGRPSVFDVPVEAVAGDFDLRLRTLSRSQIVSVRGAGVKLIVDRQPFAFNLLKALAVLWLLSLLVITAGLAFSTFVSWPVAVTLTIFGLLGRWVAQQLGETEDGWGRQTAEGIFGTGGDAGAKEAVRVSVDALTGLFATVTAFLPDMSVYGVAELVEQGLTIDAGHLGSAAWVTLAFALPLCSLAYITLRNKEVAP